MKRTVIVLAALLALATAGVAAAWAQTGYPSSPSSNSPASVNDQQSSTMPQQSGTAPAATNSDQASTATEPAPASDEQMPKTASPLPLIGLGGLATFASGLWVSRPRRKA